MPTPSAGLAADGTAHADDAEDVGLRPSISRWLSKVLAGTDQRHLPVTLRALIRTIATSLPSSWTADVRDPDFRRHAWCGLTMPALASLLVTTGSWLDGLADAQAGQLDGAVMGHADGAGRAVLPVLLLQLHCARCKGSGFLFG